MTLPPSGAVLIVGATSGAGKSTVSAGLCRLLHRRGGRVAPFKAQNMSNHSAVTADGGEVGRAQAMQALAAGVDIDRRMNPILLKPHSDRGSHLVVLGDDTRLVDAHNYGSVATTLKPMVMTAFNSLRDDYDWVIAEGAGGAAEINLLDRDLVNLPLARAVGMPAVLVVDIDRGGAFASAHGTIDLVPPELRDTIAGVVFNQFRGDPRLLEPGIADLEERDGIPVWGILPHLGTEPLLGVEDSLDISVGGGAVGRSARPIRVGMWWSPGRPIPIILSTVIWWWCPAAGRRWLIWLGCDLGVLTAPSSSELAIPPGGSSGFVLAIRCWVKRSTIRSNRTLAGWLDWAFSRWRPPLPTPRSCTVQPEPLRVCRCGAMRFITVDR